MTSNTTEALGHVTSTDVQQPRTIYVQFSEIGTIRKWAWEPFDKAEPLIAENGWVSDTHTLCATGDDGELADLFWRIKEKMPFHHEELLGLADRITALSAEVERLREALHSLIEQCWSCEKELTEEYYGTHYSGESLPLCKARAALRNTQ